jgi:hypothetical protein
LPRSNQPDENIDCSVVVQVQNMSNMVTVCLTKYRLNADHLIL